MVQFAAHTLQCSIGVCMVAMYTYLNCVPLGA